MLSAASARWQQQTCCMQQRELWSGMSVHRMLRTHVQDLTVAWTTWEHSGGHRQLQPRHYMTIVAQLGFAWVQTYVNNASIP